MVFLQKISKMTLAETFNKFSEEIQLLLKGNNGNYINSDDFDNTIQNAYDENAWFTPEHIRTALQHIANITKKDKIEAWLKKYPALPANSPKKVLTVMAGNIPLVWFQDMISVIMAGHIFIGKISSKDKILPQFVKKLLVTIYKSLDEEILLTEETVKDFDAVIATGSDNSAMYFEKYFGKYPNIIRRNRNSIAIIDGSETEDDLLKLSDDIFLYFGLGCRNVSKIYLPENYDITKFIDIMNKSKYSSFYSHNKYANNYDYHKSIYILNKIDHLDAGFFLMKQDEGLTSPIAVVYYEFYKKNDNLDLKLLPLNNKIQIILKKENFGSAQFPELNKYADGIDIMEFLQKI